MTTVAAPTELLFAGLPYTGKTSYLALLYLAIVQGRAGPIGLGGFRDDREYVNEISERLMRCEEAIHTVTEEQRELALSLTISGDEAFLRIPDLSGETWKDALRERRWQQDVEERVARADGFVLFVHVTEFDSGPSITAGKQAESVFDDGAAAGTNGGDEPRESEGRTGLAGDVHGERHQPTQVSLVDFLQLLCERPQRPARVSIVLSAWDLTGNALSPFEWLSTNCPLTTQYLEANQSWLLAETWGVSAQGGSFKSEEARKALLKEDAVGRAQIVTSGGDRGTVEEPILWALGVADG